MIEMKLLKMKRIKRGGANEAERGGVGIKKEKAEGKVKSRERYEVDKGERKG